MYTIYLRCGFLAILDWLPAEHQWSPCDGRGSQKESQLVRPMSKYIIHDDVSMHTGRTSVSYWLMSKQTSVDYRPISISQGLDI